MAGTSKIKSDQNAETGATVPRGGSIYDRLDQARAQREKALATPPPANDSPKPSAPPKRDRLPPVISPLEFDPPQKGSNVRPALLSLAGVILLSLVLWGQITRTPTPDVLVTTPALDAPVTQPDPNGPAAQTASQPERAATAPLPGTDVPALPVIEPLPTVNTEATDSLDLENLDAPLSAVEPTSQSR